MRPLGLPCLSLLALLGCSHNTFIGPDDAGGPDANTDGHTQDGSSPDGASPDGGNTKGQQGYTGGSRLKVKYYEGADGSEQAIGFYDTQLNQDCSFYAASDSTLRCMNLGATAQTTLFTDSGCTNPIAYVVKGCTVPTTAWTYTAGCNATYTVYNMGSAFAGTSAWSGSPGSCNAYPSGALTSLKASYDLYTIGAAISPSTYVQATETIK